MNSSMKLALKLALTVIGITILSVTIYFCYNYYNIQINVNKTTNQNFYNKTIININSTSINQTVINNILPNQSYVNNSVVLPQANETRWNLFYMVPDVPSPQTFNILLPNGLYLVLNTQDYGRDIGACDCSHIPVSQCVVDSRNIFPKEAVSNYTTDILSWQNINELCSQKPTTLFPLNNTG